jgi:protein-tyrosine phosphatase
MAPRGEPRKSINAKTTEELDEEFDYHGTSRKQYENALFNGVCSEIIDGLLYLGSDMVARNFELLQENKITHVINSAADYSANYHQDKGIQYLPLHLKDHVRENIESIFYEAIDFIEAARQAGGRVFVHCVQGISRSSTICLSYMIFTQRRSMEECLQTVRERRQIANPNMTFLTQLIWFQKRLNGGPANALPVKPKLFLVCSHQMEDPYKITCRIVMDQMYNFSQGPKTKKLDPRGIYLVQGEEGKPLYVW